MISKVCRRLCIGRQTETPLIDPATPNAAPCCLSSQTAGREAQADDSNVRAAVFAQAAPADESTSHREAERPAVSTESDHKETGDSSTAVEEDQPDVPQGAVEEVSEDAPAVERVKAGAATPNSVSTENPEGTWPQVNYPASTHLRWAWAHSWSPSRRLKNANFFRFSHPRRSPADLVTILEKLIDQDQPVVLRPGEDRASSKRDVVLPNVRSAVEWLRMRASLASTAVEEASEGLDAAERT